MKEGFYVGPAVTHYRFRNVWISVASSTHIYNTVKRFLLNLSIPTAKRDQIIIVSASGLTKALLTSNNYSLLPPLYNGTR